MYNFAQLIKDKFVIRQINKCHKLVHFNLSAHSEPMLQRNQSHRLTESEFEDKLNQIVKAIRLKEEINLELIEYLQLILTNSQELSFMVFLQDQISKHKLFKQKIHSKNTQLQTKLNHLQNFYQSNISLNQMEKSLLRRVSARILQVFQSYNQKVQKYACFEKQISNHYKIIKPKFLKQISHIDKNLSTMLNISQLCNSFFTYLQNKYNDQIRKINQIIDFIENGQINLIQSAFICEHCKSLQISTPIQVQSTKKIASDKIIQPSKQVYETPQQKYFEKQKQKINEKLKIMRQQAKNKQAIKKKKLKFATKYYLLYHHAMDIHKGFFMDQYTFLDENQQKSKILLEMQQRNKNNLSFIHSYIEECTVKNMEQKVALGIQFIDVKSREQESKKEEEIKSQSSSKNKKIERSHDFSDIIIERDSPEHKNYQSISQQVNPQPAINYQMPIQSQERNQVKSFRITNSGRKNALPTPKSNPNLFSIKQFGRSVESFNFVKINMKNTPIQRARLPDISNRILSMQQRQKSSKIIERMDSNNSHNTNLLIIKTSLIKGTIDNKRIQKKKKSDESNKIQNVIAKLDKNNTSKIQKRMIENSISPITINPIGTGGSSIATITRSKKIKHSDSGNKVVFQKNQMLSFKTLQINYSSHLNKKNKNPSQTLLLPQTPP